MNRRHSILLLARDAAAFLIVVGSVFLVYPSSARQLVERALPGLRVPGGKRVTGEGIHKIGADAWHQAGITGAGPRIGILHRDFAGYRELLGTELPVDVIHSGGIDRSIVLNEATKHDKQTTAFTIG